MAAAAASQFDRIATHIVQPNVLRYAVIEEQCTEGLRRQLGRVTHESARSPEVILYVCLYLEHALPDHEEGPHKKEIAMRVLAPYFTREEDRTGLSAVIDFVCARDLVKKTPMLRRIYRIFIKWLEFKIF